MNLVIKKGTLQNFDLAASIEWMELSQTGSYACTTIYGMNNRRYHGLFAIPLQNGNEYAIILSKIEESVFIDNHVYELSTNNYVGAVYPDGYKYLDEFELNPFPTYTFKIGNRRIRKTVFMIHDSNTLLIRYENKNQGSPLKLILKPLVAARRTREMLHELPNLNTDSYLSERVVKIALKANMPELSIYYLKGEFIQAPLWYHKFRYMPQVFEGTEDPEELTEDLFNPGFFSCKLEAYDVFDMFITTENKIPEMNYEAMYHREKNFRRRYRSKFIKLPQHVKSISKKVELSRLKISKKIPYVFRKYHDYTYSTREYLWTLNGMIYVERNTSRINQFIEEIIENIQNGLLPVKYPFPYHTEKEDYCAADLPLIFINFVYHYYILNKDLLYLENVLFETCKEIIEQFQKGTEFKIILDKDNLLSCGNEHIRISAVLTKNDTQRYGKLVELQALWYNALKILEFFARELKKNRNAKKYAAMAKKTENSFLSHFVDKKNSLFYDVIREDYSDTALRFHHVYPIALPFPLIQGDLALLLLKVIEDELFTQFGLRTLSPRHTDFVPRSRERLSIGDAEYYCGPILPWTIGLYCDAVLQVRGVHQQVVAYLKKLLDGYKELIHSGTVGSISELYADEKPRHRNGAQHYPLALTEYLRAYLTITSYQSH